MTAILMSPEEYSRHMEILKKAEEATETVEVRQWVDRILFAMVKLKMQKRVSQGRLNPDFVNKLSNHVVGEIRTHYRASGGMIGQGVHNGITTGDIRRYQLEYPFEWEIVNIEFRAWNEYPHGASDAKRGLAIQSNVKEYLAKVGDSSVSLDC